MHEYIAGPQTVAKLFVLQTACTKAYSQAADGRNLLLGTAQFTPAIMMATIIYRHVGLQS